MRIWNCVLKWMPSVNTPRRNQLLDQMKQACVHTRFHTQAHPNKSNLKGFKHMHKHTLGIITSQTMSKSPCTLFQTAPPFFLLLSLFSPLSPPTGQRRVKQVWRISPQNLSYLAELFSLSAYILPSYTISRCAFCSLVWFFALGSDPPLVQLLK